MPKPRLTHEEKMAELRARGKEDSELLELLANANVGKAELAQLLSDRAKRAEVTVEKRVEEEARSDRDATGLSLADWGSATERRDDRPLRVQAEEIIAKLRLEHGGGAKGFVYFVESGDGERFLPRESPRFRRGPPAERKADHLRARRCQAGRRKAVRHRTKN